MKTILTAFVFAAILGGAAYATGLTDPIVEPEVVVADAVQSSGNVEAILFALAIMVIVLGASSAF